MSKKSILLVAFLLVGNLSMVFAWGIWGHQHINHAAVYALPEEMRVFFYNHSDFLTEESSIPDLRKYTLNDKAEGPRHYIDIEGFDAKTIAEFPHTSKEAKAKYADSTLQRLGSLPWYIQDVMDKLTIAMKERRKTEILFLAGDLAHYLGDAHMPLHTALNHDGQFTDQKGIHSFWEAQLPELFGSTFNFKVDNAVFIPDVTKETWRIIEQSHSLEEPLLKTERELKATFPKDKIYQKDSSGAIYKNKFGQQVHTKEYAEAYYKALNGMVEKQLRGAITATANFWYTAWVNAGKPDLTSLDAKEVTERNREFLKQDYKAYQEGKLNGFKTETEF